MEHYDVQVELAGRPDDRPRRHIVDGLVCHSPVVAPSERGHLELVFGIDRVPELLSVAAVAEKLGITRQGVLHRINTGDLPAKKVGRGYAIPASAIH